MKMIVVALALVAVATAAPVVPDSEVKLVRSNFDQSPEGSYNFGFETDAGQVRQEEGQVKEVLNEDNKPQAVVVVRGSFSYVNPDGKLETITYLADETGFHADGDSIPKGPVARR